MYTDVDSVGDDLVVTNSFTGGKRERERSAHCMNINFRYGLVIF